MGEQEYKAPEIDLRQGLPPTARLTIEPPETPEEQKARLELEKCTTLHGLKIECWKALSGIVLLIAVIAATLIIAIVMWISHPGDSATTDLCKILFSSILSGAFGYAAGINIAKAGK